MKVLFVCALPEESNKETQIFGHPVLFTGVGKINAGYKTALAIKEHSPDLVVNFGSCGSFTLEAGTLVKIKDVVNGDMDAEPLVPYSVTPFDENGGNLHISASGVSCFTSETFINTEKVEQFFQKKRELLNSCEVFEMELYSITRVCTELNVPIIAYKWVSDGGEVPDWKNNYNIGYSKFKEEIAKEIIYYYNNEYVGPTKT